jgi:hypothetical protein
MAYGYDDRPQYISLMDMIDGGGAGRSGDRFEGGGLLSLLANELFRPRGYEDRLRQRKNDTGRAVSTVVDELMRERAAMKEMERQRGLQQDRFDPRGPNQMPPMTPPAAAPMPSDYPDMSMPSIPGYTAPTASIVPEVPVEPAPMRQPATGMTYNLMEGQEFADFMKLQRELEQEMGFQPQSVDDIYNMFKTWKSRGY